MMQKIFQKTLILAAVVSLGAGFWAVPAQARVSLSDLQADIEALQIRVNDLETENVNQQNQIDSILDQSCPPGEVVVGINADGTLQCSWHLGESTVYSEDFIQGQAPSGTMCTNWQDFRAGLTGSFSQISMSGSNGGPRTCTDPALVTDITDALRTGSATTVACNGFVWRVGTCGGIELSVAASTPSICQCPSSGYYTIRPCISNSNWGGINTDTCYGPSQTITVEVIR